MYSLTVSEDCSPGSNLDKLVSNLLDVRQRLDLRQKVSPVDFEKIMKLREETHLKGELVRLSMKSSASFFIQRYVKSIIVYFVTTYTLIA